jgi:hypothetical protein
MNNELLSEHELRRLCEMANRILELDSFATPGPWKAKSPGSVHSGDGAAILAPMVVAATGRGQHVYANPAGGVMPSADRDWIAETRQMVPELARLTLKAAEWIQNSQEREERPKLPEATGPGEFAQIHGPEVDGYGVHSWSCDPVSGRTPAEAVLFCLRIKLDGVPAEIRMRLKDRAAVDLLIDALERHKVDVWTHSKRKLK